MMMIEEAREKWAPKNFFIQALAGNARALRLYNSVGFREFARIPDYNNHFGEYMDEVWLRLEK